MLNKIQLVINTGKATITNAYMMNATFPKVLNHLNLRSLLTNKAMIKNNEAR